MPKSTSPVKTEEQPYQSPKAKFFYRGAFVLAKRKDEGSVSKQQAAPRSASKDSKDGKKSPKK